MKTNQFLLRIAALFTLLATLVACAPAAAPSSGATPAAAMPTEQATVAASQGMSSTQTMSSTQATAAGTAGSMDALIAAAKAEGSLTTIALPHDWCNYGGVIDGFSQKYGLKINELLPNGGSGDELEAIRANKNNKGLRRLMWSTLVWHSDRRPNKKV